MTQVAEGSLSEENYMEKLNKYIRSMVETAEHENHLAKLGNYYRQVAGFYKTKTGSKKTKRKKS